MTRKSKATEYRKKAGRLRADAQMMMIAEAKQQVLEIADRYDYLADQAEYQMMAYGGTSG